MAKTGIGESAETAAAPIKQYELLTADQQSTVRRIALRTYELAELEVAHQTRAGSPEDYQRKQFVRRPQNVFLIDGSRGSGKTTMMFTVRWIMGYLGRPKRILKSEEAAKFFIELRKDIEAGIDAGQVDLEGLSANLRASDVLERPHNAHGDKELQTICTLTALFPSDLEHSQPLLEGVFALMNQKIETAKKDVERLEYVSGSAFISKSDYVKKLEDLQEQLFERVVSGWYLSRPEGEEALLRESLNIRQYFDVRGKYGGRSFQRVNEWRAFVNDFLDTLGFQTLGIFLDDTDVRPEATADMLNSIRIFFDHPRIITVVAGNIRSMRESLLLTGMKDLAPAIEALDNSSDVEAFEWRRHLRQHIEEYLDKVLPRFNRFYLDIKTNLRGVPSDEDFNKILQAPFDAFCRDQLVRFEQKFILSRLLSFLEPHVDLKEPSAAVDKLARENYMAWWLFWTGYGVELRPRSIRQLRVMKRLTSPNPAGPTISHRIGREHEKRLAVVLFDAPDNFLLSHRFSDKDANVISWLRRQNTKASWSGERHFELNGRKLFSGDYSYYYLCFRLDLEIALSSRRNAHMLPPRGLLPIPSGVNFFDAVPFYAEPPKSQVRFGVGHVMRHAAIPSNCIYFSDLEYLPEIAWSNEAAAAGDDWGNSLNYNWRRLFVSARDGENTRRGGIPTEWFELLENKELIDRTPEDMRPFLREASAIAEGAANQECVQRLENELDAYWSEVVIPIASLDVLPYFHMDVTPDRNSKRLCETEWRANYFDEAIPYLEKLRRQFDYFGHLAKTNAGPTLVSDAANHIVTEARENLFSPLIGQEGAADFF